MKARSWSAISRPSRDEIDHPGSGSRARHEGTRACDSGTTAPNASAARPRRASARSRRGRERSPREQRVHRKGSACASRGRMRVPSGASARVGSTDARAVSERARTEGQRARSESARRSIVCARERPEGADARRPSRRCLPQGACARNQSEQRALVRRYDRPMPVHIDAEATCHNCGAKARCTLDVDLLMSKRFASPGGAILRAARLVLQRGKPEPDLHRQPRLLPEVRGRSDQDLELQGRVETLRLSRPDLVENGTGCAGLHPDFPDREEDDLPDCWAPFEGRVTVGRE